MTVWILVLVIQLQGGITAQRFEYPTQADCAATSNQLGDWMKTSDVHGLTVCVKEIRAK